MCLTLLPTAMRPGLVMSIQAIYTLSELSRLKDATPLAAGYAAANAIGLTLSGIK